MSNQTKIPFEDELLALEGTEERIYLIRGQAFVIRLATDDDFDKATVFQPFEQPRGEGPR
jgi:2-C-methyl-D-erythritol 4-phosphate cytidylyltransferase